MRETNYDSRFAARRDELEWLFMELYNDRAALKHLEREMEQAFAARPADLHDLDAHRAAHPDWYKQPDMLGMTMYTDLFAGSIKGLAQMLPYLQEQNIRYLQ